MFNNRNEYLLAKLDVTLHKILSIKDKKIVLNIYDKYTNYQKNIYSQLQDFELDSIDNLDLKILKQKLETQSLFYSYCFDHYNLIPSLLISLGYKVVILVGDGLLNNLKTFFEAEKKRLAAKYNISVNVQFLTNTTPNLLFRLKQEVANGNKILVFVDGNKGNSNEKEANLHLTHFKGYNILFHQGFGVLNYILGNDTLTGVLLRSNQPKLQIEIFNDEIDRNLNIKNYMATTSEILIKHLDRIIEIDNVHLWNSLPNIHEWFVIDEDHKGIGYVPFKLNNKVYFAIEYNTFKVYPINKKEYQILK